MLTIARIAVLFTFFSFVQGSSAAITSSSYDASGNQLTQQAANASAPTIVSQPVQKKIVSSGEAFGVSVGVISITAATYQWYFNGTAITGATGGTLLIPNFTSINEGSYTIVATNAFGSVTSSAITAYIDANGNGLPDSWELATFGNLNQTADGDFNGNGISNLQEFLNGTDPTIQQTTDYWVAASGEFNNPSNWSLNRVPGPADNAVINSGTFSVSDSTTITAGRVIVSVPFTALTGANQTLNITGLWTFTGGFTLVSGRQFEVMGGGSVVVTGATNLNGANLLVESGSSLSFATLASYAVPAGLSVLWTVQHDGSVLSFPNLQSITGPTVGNTYLDLLAQYNSGVGAMLLLPALTTVTKADDGDTYANSGVRFTANGGSTISAPILSVFNDNDSHPNSSLTAQNDGVLSMPMLTAPQGVNVNVNAVSHPERFTSLSGASSFELNDGSVVMSNLTSIVGLTSILADNGGQVEFPTVTSYAVPAGLSVLWTVQHDGSVLSFPNLQSITGPTVGNTYLDLLAQYNSGVGAMLLLPALTTVTKADDGDTYANSGVRFTANGGSTISAPILSVFNDNDSHPNSSLTAQNDGVLSMPMLTAPQGVNVNVNAVSHPEQFTSLVGTTSFEINEGVVVMSNLTSISGFSSITADNGAQLSFPNVTSYAVPTGLNVQWLAQHDGSVLSFPSLQSIAGPNVPNTYFDLVSRYNNGVGSFLSLPALTTITKSDDGDAYANSGVRFTVDSGTTISALSLSVFSDNDSHPGSSLNATAGGYLIFPLLEQSGIRGVALNGVVTGHNASYPNQGTIPMITSMSSTGAQTTQPFSYQVTATNSPTAFEASGLPAGLSINSVGLISGTPTLVGRFPVALSAVNASGVGTATLVLTVLPAGVVPVFGITSTTSTGAQAGQAFYYQITATNNPTSFSAAGLPAGLSINTATGVISGTPTEQPYTNFGTTFRATLTYTVTVTATGATGTYTSTLTLTVAPAATPEPIISSALAMDAKQGELFTYQITASNSPMSYQAAGLPPGLAFDSTAGIITGTPTQLGSYSVALQALNIGGTGSATMTLNVVEDLPVVTLVATTPEVTLGSGEKGIFTVTLSEVQDKDVVINYTIKGSAANGTDYALLTGMKKIKAGKTSKPIKIVPIGDLGGASKRVVKLTLASGTGYTIGTATFVKLKILASE